MVDIAGGLVVEGLVRPLEVVEGEVGALPSSEAGRRPSVAGFEGPAR